MSDHEFSETDQRCVHCGTLKAQHEQKAQPCPRASNSSELRPEPAVRRYAVNDIDTIHARLAELKTAREASWNNPTTD